MTKVMNQFHGLAVLALEYEVLSISYLESFQIDYSFE